MIPAWLRRSPFDLAKRVAMWFITLSICVAGYGVGKLELLSDPVLLPLTAWDQAIPFLPWTVWLYGTITWASFLAWLQVPDQHHARRMFVAVVSACAVCWAGFVLYPTTYPRELWPLPPFSGDASWFAAWTRYELADLRAVDSPSNCFPSMHVAMATSISVTWAGFLRRPWARPLPLVWAAVVCICTLTTKQHYIVDVPGGMLAGLVGLGLARWLVRPRAAAAPVRPLVVERPADVALVAAMRARVAGHQWSLEDIPWPEGPLPPLDRRLVRLLNHIIYIEEIAGLNFRFEQQASGDADLAALYGYFADEERRHADGLRRILALHGAPLELPGLGNALVLDQFDTLSPTSLRDAVLVAVSTPVFETFLDAGTIPFLQTHPALRSAALDAFIERVGRDEAQHIALNWLLTRQMARRYAGWRSLSLLLNPSILRGMVAVPWMSLDVYSLAHAMGYRFETLLPAFGKLWRLHRRYPELATFAPWQLQRLFVICGVTATVTCIALARARLMTVRFWVLFTRLTDYLAWARFGHRLRARRGLSLR